MTTVIIDTEAAAALLGNAPNKIERVMKYIDASKGRRRRNPNATTILVPTTVRVEAHWDRTKPNAANANRLVSQDHELGTEAANRAARLADAHNVSPADAHIGAIAADRHQDVTVLTSDPGDMEAVTNGEARIIQI